MAEPATHTVTIDLPAGTSDGIAVMLPYIAFAVIVAFSAMLAVTVAFALRRWSPKQARRTTIVIASAVSVLPIMGLALVGVADYGAAEDVIYTLLQLVPSLALSLAIAALISAPLAWLVTRPRKGTASAAIFE
jgi:hypothetical protein